MHSLAAHSLPAAAALHWQRPAATVTVNTTCLPTYATMPHKSVVFCTPRNIYFAKIETPVERLGCRRHPPQADHRPGTPPHGASITARSLGVDATSWAGSSALNSSVRAASSRKRSTTPRLMAT